MNTVPERDVQALNVTQSNTAVMKEYLCIMQALTEYRAELRDDPIINTHLAKLYDNLLEQNLIRVIEPFSRVQVKTPQGSMSPCHNTTQWRVKRFSVKGPILSPFSYLYFSSQSPVEQCHTINYPKKTLVNPQKVAYLALHS